MNLPKKQFAFCLFLLVIAGAIWGLGFVASKWSLLGLGPFWANGLRYQFAALCSVPLLLLFRTWQRPISFWPNALIASCFLLSGAIFQVIGLKYTTVAKSSFLTSLYAFFIPLILLVTGKRKIPILYWPLLCLCLFGMALMCNLSFDDFNIGDFYTLLCALAFAFHILFLEKIASQIENGFEFNCVQCLLIGIMAPLLARFFEGPLPIAVFKGEHAFMVVLSLLILGIFSSIIAFGIQVYTQKIIPSHIVGPLFLLESPFGAFFGFVFLNEKLAFLNIAGAILIILSVAVIPLSERWDRNNIFSK